MKEINKILSEIVKEEVKVSKTITGPFVQTHIINFPDLRSALSFIEEKEKNEVALKEMNLRVLPNVIGASRVGIEIPNYPRKEVSLLDMIDGNQVHDLKIPISLGKNTFGVKNYLDLYQAGNLLVAGDSGSGKSTFLNSAVVSLLELIPHDKLGLILIDPMQLQFAEFDTLPQQLLPRATDLTQATDSLRWVLKEIDQRNSNIMFKRKIPYTVVFIDRYLELISSDNGEIENLINFIAEYGPSVGIHTVLVVENAKKQLHDRINRFFSHRAVFRLSDPESSKNLIGSTDATKLLGQGDMLLKSHHEVSRYHAPNITDEEIDEIVKRHNSISRFKRKPLKKDSESMTFKEEHISDKDYFEIARTIEDSLNQFNVYSRIINIRKGPVVDTFELELDAGVNVASLVNRTEDISLALRGLPIRIVYPLQGKTTIGIEVPKNPRDPISLDEVLKCPVFDNSNYSLPIPLGKNTSGEPTFIDLATTPHLLIAGITGSGKSVFINNIILSLITKLSPKDLRLVLIDTKELDLTCYASLPHLAMPVVTDKQKASLSLKWAIEEMERRYASFKEFGIKNIEAFNKKTQKEMPYLVILIDEFADLKLSKSGNDIETSICRLAARGKACGIHIVFATQLPTTDVITGIIKANFPNRVAFRVTNNIDSRVILDTVGAEKLLGRGDMLYKQGIEVRRMHAAFVSEDEIEEFVEKLAQYPVQHDSSAMEFMEKNKNMVEEYEEAVKLVLLYNVASASMLQRRMGIGYNHAADLIDEMERKGVVGPVNGTKPRKILVKK